VVFQIHNLFFGVFIFVGHGLTNKLSCQSRCTFQYFITEMTLTLRDAGVFVGQKPLQCVHINLARTR
jgi:hypothetical protein